LPMLSVQVVALASMMMCHSEMEAAHIILIAVYDDGLLITIDGKSYFHHQTTQQQLWMAQELIAKSQEAKRKYGEED